MKVSVNLLTQSIRYSLFASALAFPFTTLAAEEVAEVESTQLESEQQDEEIEVFQVTGSRIKQSSFEGPNPVTIITSEDMLKRGHTSLMDALGDLTQNSGLVDTSEVGTNGFTPGANAVNLRGLGPQYTLTLVNGRRLASYPSAYQGTTSIVSVGSIPTAAIDRIEILTTGASAVYGSDAVSGVINIILKKDLEGTDLSLVYGTGEDHKKDDARITLTHGIDFDKGNVTIIAEAHNADAISGGDIDDIDSAFDYPYGDPVMSRGAVLIDNWAAYDYLLNPTGEPTYLDPGVNGCDNLPWTSYQDRKQLPEAIELGQTAGSWGKYCGYDHVKNAVLRPETEKYSLLITGNYELGDDVNGFVDVLYTNSSTTTDSGYLAVNGGTIELETGANQLKVKGPDGQYLVMPDWYTMGRILPKEEIGDTAWHLDDSALSVTVGANGYIGDHNWEVYFLNSQNQLDSNQKALRYQETEEMFFGNYIKDQLGVRVYDGTGTHNIYEPLSAEEQRRLIGTIESKNKTSSNIFSASISGDVFELPAGNIQYAAVFEYVTEDFEFFPDELTTKPEGEGWWGIGGFSGFGERSRSSVGGELKAPITDNLAVNVALRYDQYDGDSAANAESFTPSYSVEFRPNDDWLFRASYARSFKAPDMQAIFTKSKGFAFGTDYVSCYETSFADDISAKEFITNQTYYSACLGSQFDVEQLPTKELKHEEGTSIGLGFVFSPISEFTLTFDYYDVEIRNQVRQGDVSSILIEDFHCLYGTAESAPTFGCDVISGTDERVGLVIRDTDVDENDEFSGGDLLAVNTSSFNLASYRTTGYDLKASYLYDLDSWGQVSLSSALTKIVSSEYDALANDDQPANEFSGSIANRQPDEVITAAISYSYENFSTTLSGHYMSPLAPHRIQAQKDQNGQTIYFDKYGDPLVYEINDIGNGEREFIVTEGYYQGEDARVVGEAKRSEKRLDAYITANLNFSYLMNDGDTSVALTVKNVFDSKAPKDDTFAATDWPWYSVYSYSGSALGREMYISLNHHF
ncbi:TonB-dependent receptor domain-containing protein [Thalassotalea crassostreae]|uniref:TonB-dependent receptor domain-containing protein n=1 Tax=Thalassotalea crassostreae TaxID=1763536 RepID=UPI0008383422|nr:TonB-dependent receptor [Thalassotalea crassostreae]